LALAVLRIAIGVLFLIFAQYKVFGTQFTLHGGFQFWINRFLEDGAYPFIKPLLKNFVLAHATPLAFFVAYGELAIASRWWREFLCAPPVLWTYFYVEPALLLELSGPQAPLWQYFGASLDHSVLALCFLTFLIGEPMLRCHSAT